MLLNYKGFFKCILLLTLWLAGCSLSPSTVVITSIAKNYPFVPIPDRIFYQGITIERGGLEGLTSVRFYADEDVFPNESDASSYYLALLRQNGWEICTGSKCKLIDIITDTRILGVYQYGQETDSPILMVSINTMIKPGQQTTLYLKNCSEVKETQDQNFSSPEGCPVLLPDKFSAP